MDVSIIKQFLVIYSLSYFPCPRLLEIELWPLCNDAIQQQARKREREIEIDLARPVIFSNEREGCFASGPNERSRWPGILKFHAKIEDLFCLVSHCVSLYIINGKYSSFSQSFMKCTMNWLCT
jgi:hypothetical protein